MLSQRLNIKSIKQISDKIASNIGRSSKLNSQDEIEQMSYALQVIMNEGLKLLFLSILFLTVGKLDLFLFSFVILSTLRIFAGGYHSNSFLGCLMFSLFFFSITMIGSIYLANYIISYHLYIFTITLLVIVIKSPIGSKYRPIKYGKRYLVLKILAVIATIFWYVILVLLKYNTKLFCMGIITIAMESIQLLLKRGNEHATN
ncbi:accessory gene regulator B family protein [Clostridiaceae bacterium M8S5]|nr:accessory gene regulator B family protein [Clostridiaceae bacterium M8S5]